MSKGNNKCDPSRAAAKALLRVVPLVMRTIRARMRSCPEFRSVPLSIPQFRTLNFVNSHPESSLSDAAQHIGVTLPTMSRMVEGLVDRKMLNRQGHADDRRRLTLHLTGRGKVLLKEAHEFTGSSLASQLSSLGGEDLEVVIRAMGILYPLFAVVSTAGKKEFKRD